MRSFSLIAFTAGLILVNVVKADEPIASGLNQLAIYDPGTHERGIPAVILEEIGGKLEVEIPPKVHVHRYYYSGDQEVQGPIIEGGPTIVVANHPKTGNRMYIDVVLPAGAPKISYNVHGITYVFANRRVAIHFQHFPFNPEKAVVSYHSGRGVHRRLGEASQHVASSTKNTLSQSEFFQSCKETLVNTGDLALGITQATCSLGSQTLNAANSIFDVLPGVAPLRSSKQSRAESRYAAGIKETDLKQRKQETPFVPTIR